LTDALKSALDSAHTISSRQCDAVAEAHRQFAALFAATPNLNGCTSLGLDFVKRALATGVAQAVALAEIATKAQVEALTIFGRSVADTLDGLKPVLLAGGTDPGRSVGILSRGGRGRWRPRAARPRSANRDSIPLSA
jgi:hypothetical protein